MEKVNLDGINIAFGRIGRGLPLVLIHGYPLDHSIWNEVIHFLEEEYDLIIPDLRGFGGSDARESEHSIVDYADDLAGLLNHLGIKKAYFAGHSMGGYVVLAFVRKYPEQILGAAMVSTQILADTSERKENRLATAKKVLVEGTAGVAESMSTKLTNDERLQKQVHELISHQRPLGIYCALNAMAYRPDSTELFENIHIPVVIVHGDADQLIPVERGREMKMVLPSAKYVELAGSGHLPMMENPPAVADALRFFITKRVWNENSSD